MNLVELRKEAKSKKTSAARLDKKALKEALDGLADDPSPKLFTLDKKSFTISQFVTQTLNHNARWINSLLKEIS